MTLGAKQNKRRFEDLSPHMQKASLRTVRYMAIAGWLLLIGCGVYAWNEARFVRESVEDTAKVIEVKEHWSHDSDTGKSVTYSPTFHFQTAGGESYTVTPWYSSSRWGFSEGKEITIRYRPSEPEKAVPYGYADQLLGVSIVTWVILSIGGFLALLGSFGLWDLRRRMRSARDLPTGRITEA